MEVTIELVKAKLLFGIKTNTALHTANTGVLWRTFMQNKQNIENQIQGNLYSVEVYPVDYFNSFDPNKIFEKWAAAEVSKHTQILNGFENFVIPEGLYAKFLYRGHPQMAQESFAYIFNTWLPNSIYVLDYRPHFEVMDHRYKNNDTNSEEHFYIPIKPRT